MGDVAKTLGLIHAESSTATVRAVFIVDDKGVIRAILYYPLELGRNVDEILRMVEALQVSDRTKRAIPANWPNNEIIEEALIAPPASTVEEAKRRLETYDCYD